MKIDILATILDIDRITATTPANRSLLLKYAGTLGDELVIKAIKQGEAFFYEKRYHHKQLSRPILQYCGLIRAIKKYQYADRVAIHRKCDDVDSIEEVHLARSKAAMLKRATPRKSCGLDMHLSELAQFQKDGYSLRDMVTYLKQRNITVSHETIRRKLNEIRNNQQDQLAEP